jgi:uncharacterized protein
LTTDGDNLLSKEANGIDSRMTCRNRISNTCLSIIPLIIISSMLAMLSAPLSVNAASFNCADAHSEFEKKVCSVPALSASDTVMSESYDAAMHTLSEPGKTILRNGQRQWLKVVARVCLGNKGDEGPARCLQRQYDSRIRALHNAAITVGPFLFSRIDMYKTGGKDSVSGMPFELYRGVPRIDRPQSDTAGQWNAGMAKAMEAISGQAFWCDSGEDEINGDDFVNFAIRAATADLISINVSHTEVCDGGRYFPTAQNITYLLKPAVHPIKAADVFRAGSGWESFLTNRAFMRWTDADQRQEMKADIRSFMLGSINNDVRDPRSWSFTKDALVLSFNPGDATAATEGIVEMSVRWSDLTRFLVSDAPIPR